MKAESYNYLAAIRTLSIYVTRLPEFYDGTYEYLKSIGIKEL